MADQRELMNTVRIGMEELLAQLCERLRDEDLDGEGQEEDVLAAVRDLRHCRRTLFGPMMSPLKKFCARNPE